VRQNVTNKYAFSAFGYAEGRLTQNAVIALGGVVLAKEHSWREFTCKVIQAKQIPNMVGISNIVLCGIKLGLP